MRLGEQHTLAGNPVRFENGRVDLREDLKWRDRMGRGRRALVTALTFPLLRHYGFGSGNGKAPVEEAGPEGAPLAGQSRRSRTPEEPASPHPADASGSAA